MREERQQIADLEQQIIDLKIENRYLAEEAEQSLHARIISEKLEREQSEEGVIHTAVENIVTYHRLKLAAYLKKDGEELHVASCYAIGQKSLLEGARFPFTAELLGQIESMDGYIDIPSTPLEVIPFLPEREGFLDGYLLPIYIDEQLHGIVFVANSDPTANVQQNHLNAVVTPVGLMEHYLTHRIFVASLEAKVIDRTAQLAQDIQERREIERQLKEEQNLFVGGPLVIFKWKNAAGWPIEYVSENVKDILGYSSEEFVSGEVSYANIIHKEDVELVASEVSAADTEGRDYFEHTPYRIMHEDGHVIWLNDHTTIIRNSKGNATHFLGYVSDTTRNEKAKNELLLSQQRLRLHVEQTPLGIIEWDTNFKVMEWNPAAENIFGFSRNEAIGCHAIGLIISKEMQAQVAPVWESLLQQEGGERNSNKNITKDGKIIDCEWYNTPLVNDNGETIGVTSLVHDITERVQAEKDLDESRRMLLTILDTIPSRVFWKDREGVYLGCNRLFAQDAALDDPKLIIGKNDFDMVWQDQAELYRADDFKVMESGEDRLHYEEPQTNAEGKNFWLETNKIPLRDGDDKIVGILGTYQEITDRKQIESDLHGAMKKAELANRSKSEFLANMSHEIRTPMNAIINLSYLVLQGKLEPQQRDFIEKVERSGKNLLGLINDILDFSKIEAGKLETENEQFNLNNLMDDLINIMGLSAGEKGLNIRYESPQYMSHHLIGDVLRLRQVLINLISNAIKFTDEGEVVIAIQESDKDEGSTVLEFSISDTGIGITNEQQSRLFQSFSQADSSTTRQYGGTGLGLVISKQLVDLMGGDIRVESSYGEGSTFIFTLPFKIIPSDVVRSHVEVPSNVGLEEKLSTIRGAEILLVDDNEVNLIIASEILERAGLNISKANQGAEAVEQVNRHHFDLVLMDLQMPVMDGFDATIAIRKIKPASDLPIIAMTADAMGDVKDRCLTAGMNGYVSKPIDIEQLGAELLRWVRPINSPESKPTLKSVVQQTTHIEGLNMNELLSRVGGNKELAMTVLATFKQSNSESVNQIKDALDCDDFKLALEHAHSLKGVAGNIGANEIHEIALRIEEDIKSGTSDFSENLKILKEKMTELFDNIDQIGIL
ncbi:MAG: PAS domain S-box protein [Chromatiales bacterium]|nr:PAS domain S-box protein [Chromatiales bacterium]